MTTNTSGVLDFSLNDQQAGFRLQQLEIYNWGTFHDKVWCLEVQGHNGLLTGDIGSGKSTVVDAITSLLVSPQKVAYNKAAGAELKERSLRTYVLGNYKAERGESGMAAKAVSLRDHNSYSVLLARFYNAGFGQWVTLAQVFWFRDVQAPPARFYVVADRILSIAEHFADFGNDVNSLRKRLRGMDYVEPPFDSFSTYGAAFRRRMGIESEQALDLFHQTVSMKSVGNLTDFVRQHMLEAFDAQARIRTLIDHFDNLSRAHATILRAKDQVARLGPLMDDCDQHGKLQEQAELLRECRDALKPYFARAKVTLLQTRLGHLQVEHNRLQTRLEAADALRSQHQGERDELKRAIAANGGDRIERIGTEIAAKEIDKQRKCKQANQYAELAEALELPVATDATIFAENRQRFVAIAEGARAREAEEQNAHMEAVVRLRTLRDEHDAIEKEIISLKARRSNIPEAQMHMRRDLCAALGLDASTLPYAGELLSVREDQAAWEGAIERLLHNFGLSLLVPDTHYKAVAAWVEQTRLRGRLVYFRVRLSDTSVAMPNAPESLPRKLAVKPDSPFYQWLETSLVRRFDYVCCDDLKHFQREKQAITRAGQVKTAGERHEKDDRHRIDDRRRYVLGWTNEAKIAALETTARGLQRDMQQAADAIARCMEQLATLRAQLNRLDRIAEFTDFNDLDWHPTAKAIADLEAERAHLQSASSLLNALVEQLTSVEERLRGCERERSDLQIDLGRAQEKQKSAQLALQNAQALVDAFVHPRLAALFDAVAALHDEVAGTIRLTVESCDNQESSMRDAMTARIDAQTKRLIRLRDKIMDAMRSYQIAYPVQSNEVDVSVEAADEYGEMLHKLTHDDLPRFEARFKELLNENTIREVANFQSQLLREQQNIRERVQRINKSLAAIDYNPGRYIVLEHQRSHDAELRDFSQDLRACTEGSLTGSADVQYSEGKFLQVKRIIERFKGREGYTDIDARWTKKVTDVRNWFGFSASERWREDDTEHEHYTDSGGKSGGQKEKLAYTVLAASLAYQFGLDPDAVRSRTFRFVVIDEAFGRGSEESARFGLELFKGLHLQLLIVTPLQKIQVIEPFVRSVGFVHNEGGQDSRLQNMTIETFRAEREARQRALRTTPVSLASADNTG